MRKTHRSTRIGLFFGLAALVSLGIGIHLGSRSEQVRKNALELSRLEQVASSSRQLGLAVQSELGAIRDEALALVSNGHAIGTSTEKYPRILHLAVFRRALDGLHLTRAGFRLSEAGRTDLHSADGGPWERSYLRQLEQGLRLEELDQLGMTALTPRPDEQGSVEWLALAFADHSEPGQVVVALIDPAHVLDGMLSSAATGGTRFYLLDRRGVVLAHSQPSYVGSKFRSAAIFRKGIAGGMHPGRYASMDRIPVYAAFNQPGGLPVYLGAERVATEADAFSYQRTGQWMLGIAIWMIALLGLGALLRRELRLEDLDGAFEVAGEPEDGSDFAFQSHVLETSPPELSLEEVDGAIQALQAAQENKAQERTEAEAAREALRMAREEQAFVARFENDTARIKDPKHVAKSFAQATAELCRSPTLFFAYHEGVEAALLVADGGYPEHDAPIGMSFPIDAAAIERIQEIEKGGQTASLAQYEPLTRVLLARLGVAHFEAWAVTAYGHLGRASGKVKLLGVLVILQSGMDTVSRHESLSRMMRATGLIYENALLAQ
jgi:hypothetical protein